MSTIDEDDESLLKNYLSLFKIESRIYLIGTFQQGITVYKQQIRALNIFYSLCKTGVIKQNADKKFHVGVVGAGVAGLTFVAAALKAGLIVTLFEKESKSLHLQYGCDIRKIHPNLYDWPEKDAFFPYAKIPVLTWKYDSAANVARQIVSEFSLITNRYRPHFSPVYNVRKITVANRPDKISCTFESDLNNDLSKSRTLGCAVDLLIYATGFGVEKGTPSYWRNDDFGQPILSLKKINATTGKIIRKKIFISGIGDGALIDLFRIKVCGFSFDGVYEKARQNQETAFPLIEDLKKIKAEWNNLDEKPPEEDCWLYKKFQELSLTSYDFIYHYLEDKLVNEIEVILNSPLPNFEIAFDLRKISMLNAFMAFVFKQHGLFKYEPGKLQIKNNKYYLNDKIVHDKVLIRHGTDRHALLRDLGMDDKKIKELQTLQEKNNLWDKNRPLWSFTQLKSLFDEEVSNISFFTSETVSILSNFVSVISKLLTNFFEIPRKFRVTLYRIIAEGKTTSGNESHLSFQQITKYFGFGDYDGKQNEIGRSFIIDANSLVGLSILTGNAFLFKNLRQRDCTRLLKIVKIGDNDTHSSPGSALTIPLLGTFDGRLATNLVLYAESIDKKFFDDCEVLDIIIDCLGGFIDSINNLLSERHIYMSPLEFEPAFCEENFDHTKFHNPCLTNLSATMDRLMFKNNTLNFNENYHSFDIVYRRLLEY